MEVNRRPVFFFHNASPVKKKKLQAAARKEVKRLPESIASIKQVAVVTVPVAVGTSLVDDDHPFQLEPSPTRGGGQNRSLVASSSGALVEVEETICNPRDACYSLHCSHSLGSQLVADEESYRWRQLMEALTSFNPLDERGRNMMVAEAQSRHRIRSAEVDAFVTLSVAFIHALEEIEMMEEGIG